MDGRGRACVTERAQRAVDDHLATVAPTLRRHGLPRFPYGRRLGGVRFAPEFVGAAGRVLARRPSRI
jgi:hypothetical protein